MIASKNAILNIAQSMAEHASTRQATLAENLAQANTPGYKAKDLESFADAFARRGEARTVLLPSAEVKPNGNNVSLEDQVVKLSETKGQHGLALGLWERTLSMYAEALGRRR